MDGGVSALLAAEPILLSLLEQGLGSLEGVLPGLKGPGLGLDHVPEGVVPLREVLDPPAGELIVQVVGPELVVPLPAVRLSSQDPAPTAALWELVLLKCPVGPDASGARLLGAGVGPGRGLLRPWLVGMVLARNGAGCWFLG